MSFIDINKLSEQAADKIVTRVSGNLTTLIGTFQEELTFQFNGLVKDAIVDIVGGFQQIEDQLTVMTILLYVILGFLLFVTVFVIYIIVVLIAGYRESFKTAKEGGG
jgi:hypothetical protein